ncbi:MAG TPA: hypothetical protein VFF33_07160 [Ignavibacteriaceae bacterium]|nr:hypothetical protein [Ignavibacteriaceae bacterium]
MFSRIKNIFTVNNNLNIYLFIIIVFNLILTAFPLTKEFGYEFSVLNSLLLSILASLYFITLIKKYSAEIINKQEIKSNLIKASSAFIILPFAISCTNSLLTSFCSFKDGVLFYTVITIPSILIGAATGYLSYLINKKYAVLIFFLIYILILFIPAIEIYINPQVYFYNPLLGFFPGTIYDEGISVNSKLAGYRFLNLIYFGAMFFAVYKFGKVGKRKIKIIIFSGFLAAAIIFFYLSPLLGFSTSNYIIKKELDGVISTEHFEIHYSRKINEQMMKVVALHHEYYYQELSDFFNTKLHKKITSYVFYNREQKGRLFGSFNADVAKPWLNQIYTVYDSYNKTLKHELAHCFTSAFAEGPFKVADKFNPVLIEGIAMAADSSSQDFSLDFLAALAYKNGYNINLKELFEGFNFFKHSSSIGYIYSGSITKYLINNYGIDKFKKFYSNSNFQKVYGKDADTIIKEYIAYINSLNVDSLKHTANYYFGRKSIFAKECPRYVAEQQDLGWSLYDFKEYEESKEVFAGLISISNDYSSLLGYVNSLTELEKKDEAVNVLEGKIKNFEGTSYYYNLELRLADLYALTQKISKADSLYNVIIEQNASKNVVDVAKIRLILLHDEKVFTEYVSGNDITKYLILRDLNKKSYNYISFKYLINLSKALNEDYDYFLSSFDKVFDVTDYNSSYALMLLSEYMVENFDLIRARKAAALSLRYHYDAELNILLKENYRKLNWLLNNKQIAENLK